MFVVTRGNDPRCEQPDLDPGRLLIKIIVCLHVGDAMLAEQQFSGKQRAKKKDVGSQSAHGVHLRLPIEVARVTFFSRMFASIISSTS